LKKFLGLDDGYELVESFGVGKRGSLAVVEGSVQQRFGLDLRGIFLGQPDLTPEIIFPDGSYRNEWDVVRRAVPNSYYHTIIHHPLQGELSPDDLAHWSWPDPYDPGRYRYLRWDALRASAGGEYPVVLNFGDICVHQSQFCRGFEEWLTDIVLQPNLMHDLLTRVTDIRIAIAEEALKHIGDIVDMVETSDDVATQQGMLISPEHYREFVKPHHQRFFEAVRARTSAKIMYHCCGNVFPILNDLVEIGIDVLNPIQVSAKGMNTARLKREYGDVLTFMGGVDTQYVLSSGTPEEVRSEVQRRIDDLATGGGYILAAVHNIQPDVPPENICIMYDTALEYGQYV
jgi:uroporphyrinogen decarboxylase